MGERPVVSVVVATRNRADRLERLVEHLAAQRVTASFDLVIVDDASDDRTPAVTARLAERAAFPIRCTRLAQNSGPAAARNMGWRLATGDLIAFTDDDCMPQPDWLEAIVRRANDADVVQGVTLPDPSRLDNWGPFSHTVEIKSPTGFFETSNICYRKILLERLGGFDESFPHAYGEDTDLGWRAQEAGASFAFAPEAVVHHEVTDSSLLRYLQGLRRREGLVLLVNRHPELRQLFPGRWYQKQSHPAVIVLAAAVLGVGTRRTSMIRWAGLFASALFYMRSSLDERRIPRRRHLPLVMPQAVVADLYTVGILARASIHYRTLFL